MSSAIAKAAAVGLYSMHQPTGSLRSDKPGGPALTNINGVSAGAPINGGPASASFAAASNQYYALAQGLSDAFLLPTVNGRWWMTFGYFRRATTQGDRTIDSIDAQFITSVRNSNSTLRALAVDAGNATRFVDAASAVVNNTTYYYVVCVSTSGGSTTLELNFNNADSTPLVFAALPKVVSAPYQIGAYPGAGQGDRWDGLMAHKGTLVGAGSIPAGLKSWLVNGGAGRRINEIQTRVRRMGLLPMLTAGGLV